MEAALLLEMSRRLDSGLTIALSADDVPNLIRSPLLPLPRRAFVLRRARGRWPQTSGAPFTGRNRHGYYRLHQYTSRA